MFLIVNDFSINRKFNDLEDFFREVKMNFIPMLIHIKRLKVSILKSYDTYSRYVTENDQLADVLQIKGDAEITALKSYLVSVFYEEPYWNDDIKTNCKNQYYCKYTNKVPNCMTEALERKCSLLSFPNNNFYKANLIVNKNNMEIVVFNSFNSISLLDYLYKHRIINETYYIEHFFGSINVRFCIISGHNYTQDFFEENDIAFTDRQKIVNNMKDLIVHIVEKTEAGKLVKSLGDGILELRSDISDKRISRVFYALTSDGMIFLNGFIKKTQKTPKSELDQAKSLLKKLLTN